MQCDKSSDSLIGPCTGETSSGGASKIRSIGVHQHLHTVMQRSHVAADAVLSFHRNCHLRSHTGSSHVGSQFRCQLTFLLLCKYHKSYHEGCMTPHRDTLLYGGETAKKKYTLFV